MPTTPSTREPLRKATDTHEYPGIGDYALIGDCRSAALVSLQGSIDWLCLPHFSSPSVFAALLDRRRGGRLAVRPRAPFRSQRRYLGRTAVLETVFETADGRALIRDFMPLGGGGRHLEPQRGIIRSIEGLEGRMVLDVLFEPRPDYARRRPRLRQSGNGTVTWRDGSQVMILRSDASFELATEGDSASGVLPVGPGERTALSLAYCHRDVGILPRLEDVDRDLERTRRWWEAWSRNYRPTGPHGETVLRSAVTLKLLCATLSGAVLAAPTTSLPEAVGGIRNWDYRFCWLRDASLTLRAFIDLGFVQEAEQFLHWLLYSTRLTRPGLNVLYDLFGEYRLPEHVLSHLEGYRASAPVRCGNGAWEQRQLDVYGAVALAARLFVRRGGVLEPAERRMLEGFGKRVVRHWQSPDHGIWEVRGRQQHYTYSKLMCWAALDALLELMESGGVGGDRQNLERERARIRAAIEERAFNRQLGSYTATFDGQGADASLLAIARTGFHEAGDERMRGTFRFIDERLGRGALVYRYPAASDGLPGSEGAMLLSSFWAVDYLARIGRKKEARERFDELLGFCNDVGLMAEQVDVGSGALLGNHPQAFSHVGLITAALSLEEADDDR